MTQILQDSGYNIDKRADVIRSEPTTDAMSESRENMPQTDGRESAAAPQPSYDTTKQKRGKITRVGSYGDPENRTVGSYGNESLIDSVAAGVIQERYHFHPVADMVLRCTLNGKSEPLIGGLKYLGHLNSLPAKRNTIVAGIQLQVPEELGTDGTFLGKRYFYAPPKRAYFVPVKNCVPKIA